MSQGRPSLNLEEVEAFQDKVCRAALEIISENGTEALSFRALASLIDSSHTRVHRYFPNKAALLDAVRDYAFGLFADALERGTEGIDHPIQRLAITGTNYIQFGDEDPEAFHALFNKLDRNNTVRTNNQIRAWAAIRDPLGEAIEQNFLQGDPDVLAHVFWSTTHGMVSLRLTGNIKPDVKFEDVVQTALGGLMRGHGVQT